MSPASPTTIEEAIRHAGEEWLIESHVPPEDAVRHIQQTLDAVGREAKRRLGDNAPDLSEAALLQEYHRNPHRVRAFLQAIGGTRTPEMLLMAWRILQGMEVSHVQMNYQRQQSFELMVTLTSPDGVGDETYVSRNIKDFALFRHIGILEVAGSPVFEGLYALRVRPIRS